MAFTYTISHNDSAWTSGKVDSFIISNGSVSKEITSSVLSFLLNCDGKYMENNLIIGEKTLNCAGKIMQGNIKITTTESLDIEDNPLIEELN